MKVSSRMVPPQAEHSWSLVEVTRILVLDRIPIGIRINDQGIRDLYPRRNDNRFRRGRRTNQLCRFDLGARRR